MGCLAKLTVLRWYLNPVYPTPVDSIFVWLFGMGGEEGEITYKAQPWNSGSSHIEGEVAKSADVYSTI